ncbi:N-acetylmuramoyl-L-alanine amidase [Scytonema sp. NUACC21]
MKFGIDIGHNCPPDTGARGIQIEDNLTLDIGTRVISKLKNLGHEAISCKPSEASTVRESLAQRCQTANTARVDIFVSIHFNAFNGQANGTEVFAMSDAGREIAASVLNEIVKLGFENRGVKNGSHLYVIRNTNMTAILVECCFIDSQKDMELLNVEAMSNAIVKGLTGQTSLGNSQPKAEQNTVLSTLDIQKVLNRLKITDAEGKPLVENNISNSETKSAIKKFQEITGIQTTGIAGNTTNQVINDILAKTIIRLNHADGAVVRYLQYRVNVDIDGIYGSQSESAVKKFQQKNGLVADGIVGPLTWQKLIG